MRVNQKYLFIAKRIIYFIFVGLKRNVVGTKLQYISMVLKKNKLFVGY